MLYVFTLWRHSANLLSLESYKSIRCACLTAGCLIMMKQENGWIMFKTVTVSGHCSLAPCLASCASPCALQMATLARMLVLGPGPKESPSSPPSAAIQVRSAAFFPPPAPAGRPRLAARNGFRFLLLCGC